jgi:hypothetical protein
LVTAFAKRVAMGCYPDLLEVVLRDFIGTPTDDADVSLVVLDPQQIDAARQLVHDPASWISPDKPNDCRLLLKISKNTTALETDMDNEKLLVELASLLQDYVMDERNQTWPDVQSEGKVYVLEPFLDDAGRAVWGIPKVGTRFCLIGHLREHLT